MHFVIKDTRPNYYLARNGISWRGREGEITANEVHAGPEVAARIGLLIAANPALNLASVSVVPVKCVSVVRTEWREVAP